MKVIKNISYKISLGFLLCFLILMLNNSVTAAETVTLEQVLELGIENNAGIRQTKIDQEKAKIDLDSAKKAFYPELNISTSYTRLFLPEQEGGSNNSTIPPEVIFDPADQYIMKTLTEIMASMQPDEDNYQTSISLQQPIYLGGKIWMGMEQAEKGLNMAQVQLKEKKNELLFQIIQSYYNVLLAQERVSIEEDALALIKEHKRTTEHAYNAGTIIKTDVLQVEIEESKAIHSLEIARNDLLMAKRMLANIVGADLTDKLMVWPGFAPDILLDKNQQYDIAQESRAEIKLLNFNKEMLEINLQMEQNSHLPNIVLAANHQWQGSDFTLENGASSLTLSASMNIFDRGLSSNKQNKLKKDLKKLDINKSNLEEMIMLEIEDIILTIKENQSNLKLQELNLEKAEENLDLENKRYQVGLGTNVNVMNAQLLLKQTKIAVMQAEYQYKINLFKLLQKTGQLLDYYEGVIRNG